MKYVNKGSNYTNATFKIIKSGIINHIVKITSITEKDAQMKVKEQYQRHTNALIHADLYTKITKFERILGKPR